jgi:hypothetical protein
MTAPYTSATAVEAAIRDAARNAFAVDTSASIQDRIRQEYFRRFLSRIFSERDDSDWLLKGGTGVLARVASGRRTTDVDLFRANNTLDGALAELIRLASIDLGDFFRFVYTKHESVLGGDQQTYTDDYGVDFDVYIGADKKESLHVDLVVIATTQTVSADKLVRAIDAEARVRSLLPLTELTIPSTWGRRYAKEAKDVPYCANYRTVDLASELMRNFIDPVLLHQVAGTTWSPDSLAWS